MSHGHIGGAGRCRQALPRQVPWSQPGLMRPPTMFTTNVFCNRCCVRAIGSSDAFRCTSHYGQVFLPRRSHGWTLALVGLLPMTRCRQPSDPSARKAWLQGSKTTRICIYPRSSASAACNLASTYDNWMAEHGASAGIQLLISLSRLSRFLRTGTVEDPSHPVQAMDVPNKASFPVSRWLPQPSGACARHIPT